MAASWLRIFGECLRGQKGLQDVGIDSWLQQLVAGRHMVLSDSCAWLR